MAANSKDWPMEKKPLFIIETKIGGLKDPNQPWPFSMPMKLLKFSGNTKSQSFTVSCIPEIIFNYN